MTLLTGKKAEFNQWNFLVTQSVRVSLNFPNSIVPPLHEEENFWKSDKLQASLIVKKNFELCFKQQIHFDIVSRGHFLPTWSFC